MKYQQLGTRLLGYLTPNTNVKIKIVDVKEDIVVSVQTDVCIESTSMAGLYIFNTNLININSLNDKYKTTGPESTYESLELAYIMKNELGETYGGKVVIDNDLRILIKMNDSIAKIPDNVWNLLSEDEQTSYKNILKRIYQNTDLIPAIL